MITGVKHVEDLSFLTHIFVRAKWCVEESGYTLLLS